MRVSAATLAILVACQQGPRDKPHDEPPAPAAPVDAAPARPSPAPPRPAPPLGPLPGSRRDITAIAGAAQRVAIGDVDGDGANDIVFAEPSRLRVIHADGKEIASAPLDGGPQILIVANGEIYLGTGVSREHLHAAAAIARYRVKGGALEREPILSPATPRAEVVAILPGPDGVFLAYFDGKYTVHSVIAQRGAAGWTTRDIATLPTATAYGRADLDGDGTLDLVVGRVYGDERSSDGDAFILGPDGKRTPIPTTRGVRDLAIADTDGDGKPEVFLADGWDRNYAQRARGLLTCARRGADGTYTSEIVEDTPGQYTVGRIIPTDVDGDHVQEVVTLGNAYVRMFRRRGTAWQGVTIAGVARDAAAGDLDGKPGDELVVVGEKSEIITLR